MKEYIKKFQKAACIAGIIFLILEIFVFNYKCFIVTGRYEQRSFSKQEAQFEGLEMAEDGYKVTEDHPTITFHMNQPVRTMRFDASLDNNRGKELVADIAYSTESHKEFLNSSKKFQVVDDLKRTQYVTCSYFGNVQAIKLTLDVKKDTNIKLHTFSVNEKIPFHFSLIRFLSLEVLFCLIYGFVTYPAFRERFCLKKKSHKLATCFLFGAFIGMLIFVYHTYIGNYKWFGLESGDQMTQEIVDAFEAGQVSLLDEVPEELLKLDNPYDNSERNAKLEGIYCKWDHLMYDGKYYSYYGIAPVLTLFLPYHMITGFYFPSSLACLLYSLVGAVFIGLCFLRIIRNWFPKTSFRMVALGLITVFMSSSVFYNLVATQFYEIAQSSAFCFLVIGFYFMLSSGIFTKQKIKISRLFLSSLFVSLAVLSRATSALYAIVMVIWVFYGLVQYKKEKERKKLEVVKYLAAALIPYVVFGMIQMTYNYARFGNPLEFGIGYTLTIYDYTKIDMHLSTIMVSIVNFLFAVPIINTEFPFIHGNFDNTNLNGYYFVATSTTMGVLPTTWIILALLYAPRMAHLFPKKEKIKLGLVWLLPGVIIPVILVAMTWEYGYAIRYNADFSWQMALAALVLIYFVYHRIREPRLRKWLFFLFVLATVWCVVSNMAVIFAKCPMETVGHNVNGSYIYYNLRDAVMFWN